MPHHARSSSQHSQHSHHHGSPLEPAEVALYLTRHNCIPIILQWEPLPPAVKTYYPEMTKDGLEVGSWLADNNGLDFHTIPYRERKKLSKKAQKKCGSLVYAMKMSSHGGHFRDAKYHWKMYDNVNGSEWGSPLWSFQRKIKLDSSKRKVELQLLADNTICDGHKEDPTEALTIRERGLDEAMAVATLQVMKDTQWDEVIRFERKENKAEFINAEAQARETKLGKLACWRQEDFENKELEENVSSITESIVTAALGSGS